MIHIIQLKFCTKSFISISFSIYFVLQTVYLIYKFNNQVNSECKIYKILSIYFDLFSEKKFSLLVEQ